MHAPTTIRAMRPEVRPRFGVSEAVIAACPFASGRCEGRRARPREVEAGRRCRLRYARLQNALSSSWKNRGPAALGNEPASRFTISTACRLPSPLEKA